MIGRTKKPLIGKPRCRCQWPTGCKRMCYYDPTRSIKDRICHVHREARRREGIRLRNMTGPCIQCGESTRQKNEDGQWFHREHVKYAFIRVEFQLEEQKALEKISTDTTSLHERERYLDRMAKDAHFQTHGGESFYGPILTWRKQG